MGATVIGSASPYNHDYLRSLGATPVSYGEGLVERVCELAPNGIDVALDAAGEEASRASIELVGDKRRIGTIVAFDLIEELGIIPICSKRSTERLSELTNMYEQVLLRIVISKTFSLHQAAKAHKVIGTGHARGETCSHSGLKRLYIDKED